MFVGHSLTECLTSSTSFRKILNSDFYRGYGSDSYNTGSNKCTDTIATSGEASGSYTMNDEMYEIQNVWNQHEIH